MQRKARTNDFLDDMAQYDAIIVGGGFQGAMMALEAVRRGRRPLLVERSGFAGGASGASLGIIHGGLRYLQTLDLRRWHRSRREQAWFLAEFPQHVRSLTCVMPLYRRRFRSKALFRAAFLLDRTASLATRLPNPLANGDVLSPAQIAAPLPLPEVGLTGGARWSELALVDPRGLVTEIVQRVRAAGGDAVEQVEAVELVKEGDAVRGLVVRDRGDGREHRHDAPLVLLCAGAACRRLAERFDRDIPELSSRTLAFNLLLDLPFPDDLAFAVSPDPGRGRSYFLRGWQGRLLAGTFYAPSEDHADGDPAVPCALVEEFRADLVRAVPALAGVAVADVWQGRLPDTDGAGHTLRAHDLLWDHGEHGGPRGLLTLLGTKLTTAHALADEVGRRLWPGTAAMGLRPGAAARRA